jgi:hypothetical protein
MSNVAAVVGGFELSAASSSCPIWSDETPDPLVGTLALFPSPKSTAADTGRNRREKGPGSVDGFAVVVVADASEDGTGSGTDSSGGAEAGAKTAGLEYLPKLFFFIRAKFFFWASSKSFLRSNFSRSSPSKRSNFPGGNGPFPLSVVVVVGVVPVVTAVVAVALVVAATTVVAVAVAVVLAKSPVAYSKEERKHGRKQVKGRQEEGTAGRKIMSRKDIIHIHIHIHIHMHMHIHITYNI